MASSSSGDLKCTRCDQRGHIAEDCPHYRFDRPMHQDARTHLGNVPSLEADDGSHWILHGAVESLQPGDGHCMFHSLAAGLAFFDVVISGPALRVEISKWLKSHASVSVAGNTFAEWIYLDSRKSPAEYCSLMERTGEWGGGLELSAFAHCKQIDVHVFERREGVFHRISFIRSPTPTEKEIYVLFVGRCHYDLLIGGSMNEQPISLLGGSTERGGAAASEEHNNGEDPAAATSASESGDEPGAGDKTGSEEDNDFESDGMPEWMKHIQDDGDPGDQPRKSGGEPGTRDKTGSREAEDSDSSDMSDWLRDQVGKPRARKNFQDDGEAGDQPRKSGGEPGTRDETGSREAEDSDSSDMSDWLRDQVGKPRARKNFQDDGEAGDQPRARKKKDARAAEDSDFDNYGMGQFFQDAGEAGGQPRTRKKKDARLADDDGNDVDPLRKLQEEDDKSDSVSDSKSVASDVLSDDEDLTSALQCGVAAYKTWITVEDEEIDRIEALAAELREQPLLPPLPGDASKTWTDVNSGMALPMSHCAVRNCGWVSNDLPCTHRSPASELWIGEEGEWTLRSKCSLHANGMYACCGDVTCLRQHLVEEHGDLLARVCGPAAVLKNCYTYYLEAIAIREQQHMPSVGPSVDRRTFQHVKVDMSENAVKGLVCMCCARTLMSCNGKTQVAFIPAGSYFSMISADSFRLNWCFEEYKRRYVHRQVRNVLKDHPELSDTCWTWRRRLEIPRLHGQVILCCPEDVQCSGSHDNTVLCGKCRFPLCEDCFQTSRHKDIEDVAIPEALANDNMWGYATHLLYKYRVRWIEAAAACPVFTALITYYVEGDRGHLLNAEQHRPQRAYAVRGNVYSFHMPWEEIGRSLGQVLHEEEKEALPHPPETLANVVLFSLRIGDVVDLNKWLPQAKLRPHVVLKLLLSLVDNHYPFPRGGSNPDALKREFTKLVAERYPETEAELPEDERDGCIPPLVAKAMRASLAPVPGAKESNVRQKHGTPVATSESISVALNEARPSALFPDRSSTNIVPRDARELLALRKHYVLDVTTGKTLVDSWNSTYFAVAFPFSIPRAVSGGDFPRKRRERRTMPDAPILEPAKFARMLAARVEGSIRNDWIAVPAARNLAVKWKALCGDDAACRHAVDPNKAGVEMSAELTEAAGALYEKLEKGHWWDGRKKRKINHDVTKLQFALNLSTTEKNLAKDLTFLSGTQSGTQQVRLTMGHALFGARVEFGDPLFLTISPSSRHSGNVIRVSRYRCTDPAMWCDKAQSTSVPRWAGADEPRIWQQESGNDVIIDLPDYPLRRVMAARDPWAVMQNFILSVKYLLPRLTGLRMCLDCPNCNSNNSHQACSNEFGHNMTPLGGLAGLGVALGGSVEYQGNDNPHLHANLHVASVYQHKTLAEIGALMAKNLLCMESITDYQAWICREDHFDLEGHQNNLETLEQRWHENNSTAECHTLCQLPSYINNDSTRSLWTGSSHTDMVLAQGNSSADNKPYDAAEALADGTAFKEAYFADVQQVFSHCHHHWHAKDPSTGERRPIRGCKSKKGPHCKARFPLTKRLNLVPKVVCPGNARKHDLRVSGRRNALGSILPKRRCPWLSGTAPGFAAIFRHNTHTGPNYRVPLIKATHDKDCTSDCLKKHTLQRMTMATQRAARNTTGYYTGYIQKRQPVGKFELRQAACNLKYLAKTIEKRSNAQQYHHVANRMLGDLEYRGHVRPATEEFNLAGNYKEKDILAAEFIRTFLTSNFYGGELLRRWRQLKEDGPGTNKTCPRIPLTDGRRREGAQMSFTDTYGYRGADPRFLYLSPWEFTKWWLREPLRQPEWYVRKKLAPLTQWTESGLEYKALLADDKSKSLSAPKPGTHYVVCEPTSADAYIAFPDVPETGNVRHRWVLVRKERPDVPQPTSTPLLKKNMEADERALILSVYFRPWTLLRATASACVPLMTDLDISVTDARAPRRRITKKSAAPANDAMQRCMATAWDDYRQHHIASKHSTLLNRWELLYCSKTKRL